MYFPAFRHLFTPPKTPYLDRDFKGFLPLITDTGAQNKVFSSDFTRKVDAPVFITYLQSVRTISKLQQSSHYESRFKTGRRRTKEILGLCVKILDFIPLQYV